MQAGASLLRRTAQERAPLTAGPGSPRRPAEAGARAAAARTHVVTVLKPQAFSFRRLSFQ